MANADPSPSEKNPRTVELTASGDPAQVEARLREALDEHGLQLFARIGPRNARCPAIAWTARREELPVRRGRFGATFLISMGGAGT